MSNLSLTAQWHDDINQVETTEKIMGGASGNANLATKQLAENILWLKEFMQAYKVGDVYVTTISHTNAAAVRAHHGYGTWARFAEGRTLVCFSTKASDPADYKQMGNEFGANMHKLTIDEAPSHTHPVNFRTGGIGGSGRPATDSQASIAGNLVTESAGGDQPHNNIQPSKVVAHWLRTA